MTFNDQPKENKTLLSRIRRYLIGLVAVIVAVFVFLQFFILYGLEDALLNERLKDAAIRFERGQPLPFDIEYWPAKSSGVNPDVLIVKGSALQFSDSDNELSLNGVPYHYLRVEQGVLVLDASRSGLVTRLFDDVILLLVLAIVPVIALLLLFSYAITARAMQPFTELKKLFVGNHNEIWATREKLDDIAEDDIRQVAETLIEAIETRSKSLEEQMVFNQGLAHELRSPLQIMASSSELLALSQPSIQQDKAFLRLNRSIARIRRISNGLLWLTRTDDDDGIVDEIDVKMAFENMLAEFQGEFDRRGIKVDVTGEQGPIWKVPLDVIELVILNVFQNVWTHCGQNDDQHSMALNFDEGSVSCANTVADKANEGVTRGFGLGLMLLTKLLNRFELNVTTQISNHDFRLDIRP